MISFIVPAFNEEKLIAQCLQSILNQKNLGEFEIIVIDNGSTDKTFSIAKSLSQKVKVFYWDKKQGPAAARNFGATRAKGEILVFFDADIQAPPFWAQKVLNLFKNDKNLVAVSGPYFFPEFNFWQKLGAQVFINFALIPTSFILSWLRLGAVLIGGNIALRRWAFEKIAGFNPQKSFYGDDSDLARRLIKVGKIKFLRNLWVEASARRFLKEGYFKTQLIYTLNFFSEIFFHQPFSKKHTNIR